MRKIIIQDEAEFREKWFDMSMTVTSIADSYESSTCAVYNAAARFNLPRRSDIKAGRVEAIFDQIETPADDPEPVSAIDRLPKLPHPIFTLERDRAIMATEGSYADIADLAAEWSLQIQQVMCRYLRRLPEMKA